MCCLPPDYEIEIKKYSVVLYYYPSLFKKMVLVGVPKVWYTIIHGI